jgi:hypothetical protein
VKPRGAPSVTADELRAAKLSWIPGVTIAQACKRFGVTKTAVSRARKDPGSKPSLAELALAALTSNGTTDTGAATALDGVAAWISYIDRSPTSVDEVRALLAPLVAAGQLALDGSRWNLLRPWP